MSKNKKDDMQLPLFPPMAFVAIDKHYTSCEREAIEKAINKIDSHLRTGVFHPSTVLEQLKRSIGSVKTYQMWDLQGIAVTVTPKRLFAFRDNMQCVCCGRVGKVFIAERHVNDNDAHQYLNLYAIDDRTHDLILMTVDHILPESYGGRYNDTNFQTMCSPCNLRKNNTMTNEEIERVLLNIRDHAKEWVHQDYLFHVMRLHLKVNEEQDSRAKHALTQELGRYRKLISSSTPYAKYRKAISEIKVLLDSEKVSLELPLEATLDYWMHNLSMMLCWAR